MSILSGSGVLATTSAVCHRLEELDLRFAFWQYQAMHADEAYSFLLDSAKDPEKLGQFSFLGAEPTLVYRAKRQHGAGPAAGAAIDITQLRELDGTLLPQPRETHKIADVYTDLREQMARFHVDHDVYRDHPVPLLSGAVGYFGYEGVYFIEALPDLGKDDVAMPDVYLMFCDVVLAHCHKTGRSFLSVIGRGADEAAAEQSADRRREEALARIAAFEASSPDLEWKGPAKEQSPNGIEVRCHSDEEKYCELVNACKEHIFAGNIFEVCLTHRLEADLPGHPWDLYRELRRINPAPFAAYLNFPEAQVVSSSPERYVSLSPSGAAESRPIKGTRPRGATPAEDEATYHELFSSMKDRAENVMIVDLVRNDFGRVCRFGSVHVPELMIVEQYATVFQMVSTIRGQLDEGRDAIDLIRASFPGGSMTGAPKIESMKIIDRLEPVKRGIYSGAIGYLDFCGSMDLSIVIRTFVVRDGKCYFNVGGAIVADSEPRGEYLETMDKARALRRALANLKACGENETRRPRKPR